MQDPVWKQVFAALQVRVPDVLPFTSLCPACKGDALHSYKDTLSDSSWHYCPDCGSSGGPVVLAAAAWGCSEEEAATRVQRLSPTRTGLRDWAPAAAERAYRHSALLWGPAAPSRRRVGVDWSLAGFDRAEFEKFQSRQPRSIAVLGYAVIRQLAGQRQRALTREDRTRGGALVVPIETLPDQYSAMWMTGERIELRKDRLIPISDVTAPGALRGFAFLKSVVRADDPFFPDRAFILDDVVTAIELHRRHAESDVTTLPVVAFSPAAQFPRDASFQVFHGRKVVVWGRELSAELVRYAKAVDGRVAVDDRGGVPLGLLDQSLPLRPLAWLESIAQASVGWRDALVLFLEGIDASTRKAALHAVGMSRKEWDELVEARPKSKAARLVEPEGDLPATTSIHRVGYVEVGGEWWTGSVDKPDRLVSEATFRLSRVMVFPRGSLYCGVAQFRGTTAAFVAGSDEFCPDPFRYVQRLFVDRGVGFPSYSPRQASLALKLSAAFHPPEVVRCERRLGWQEAAKMWMFANYSIDAKGDYGPGAGLPRGVVTPTQDLPRPRLPTLGEMEALSRRSTASAVAWEAIAHVASELLAPWCGRGRTNLAVTGGRAARAFGRMCELVGCAFERVSERGRSAYAALEGLPRDCDWPTVVYRYGPGCRLSLWQNVDPAAGIVVGMRRLEADLLYLGGAWSVLRFGRVDRGAFDVPPEVRDAVPHVLPNFLRWWYPRRDKLTRRQGPTPARKWLVEWAAENGWDVEWISDSSKRGYESYPAGGPTKAALGRVLKVSGAWATAPYDPDCKCRWIDRGVFVESLERLGIAPVDELALDRAVRDSGALVKNLSTDRSWAFQALWPAEA